MRKAIWLPVVLVLSLSAAAQAEMVVRRWGTPPAGPAPAAEPKAAGKLAKAPTAYVPKADAAPKIDGKLDDAAWAKAASLKIERSLEGGGNASQPTLVRLLRDADNLYIGVRCTEPAMSKLQATAKGKDVSVGEDESIEIFIGQPQEYYHFGLSVAGGTYDARGKGGQDFDSGFVSAIARGEGEWTAEMSIPLAKIGAKEGAELIANFNRTRFAGSGRQEMAWSPTGSDDSHVPARFGKLVLGDEPKAAKPADDAAPAAPAAAGIKAGPVTITPTGTGEGIAVFDLSDLPKNATIYRADLLVFRTSRVTGADDDALVDIQILPLTEKVAANAEPKTAAKPLALRSPWFDRFDATEAVKAYASGKTNGGFFFKACPRWDAAATCLEIAYEGKAQAVPAQVKEVKALHRAGQTFITWKEVEPLVTAEQVSYGELKEKIKEPGPYRYRVYASDKPIDAKSIAQAQVIAEVAPLSAYNANGRCPEYLYGQAMDKSDRLGELAENYNGAMFGWHMDSQRMDRYPIQRFVVDEQAGPLPVGTGLYVTTAAAAGKRYYAVTACKDGVENAKDIGKDNAAGPVDEAIDAGEPVRQGDGLWGPFFDYPGKRHNYVQWVGPPLSPLPSMYFNWSVLLPPGDGQLRPVELYFHAGGYSYAKPCTKFFNHSIQFATHDYPSSGWYGFNDAYGTLKSFRQGVVGNHTQRRIIAFLEWAKKKFPIDSDRIMASGGDGAALLALNYPDMFSYMLVTGFEAGVLNPKAANGFAAIWGPKSPDIKDDQGRGEWGWAMLDKIVRDKPGRDLPMFHCGGASWGGDKGYAKGEGLFYRAMRDAGQHVSGGWSWNYRLIGPNRYNGLWRGLDLSRTTPIPAFANSTADVDSEANGHTNSQYSWKDVKDAPDAFEITVVGPNSGFDLTPRRLQQFKVKPGQKLSWSAVPAAPSAKGQPGSAPAPQNGTVEADANGVITLKGIKCENGSVTVKIAK